MADIEILSPQVLKHVLVVSGMNTADIVIRMDSMSSRDKNPFLLGGAITTALLDAAKLLAKNPSLATGLPESKRKLPPPPPRRLPGSGS